MGVVDDLERKLGADGAVLNGSTSGSETYEVDTKGWEGIYVVAVAEEDGGVYTIDLDGELHSAKESGGSYSKVKDLNTLTASADGSNANVTLIKNFERYVKVMNAATSGEGTAGEYSFVVLGAEERTA